MALRCHRAVAQQCTRQSASVWLFLAGAAGVLLVSPRASAQLVTMCQADQVDPLRVETVVTVELRRSVRMTTVGTCDGDQVQLQVVTGTQDPLLLELAVGDVAPAARARFVGLVIAEMVRTGAVPDSVAAFAAFFAGDHAPAADRQDTATMQQGRESDGARGNMDGPETVSDTSSSLGLATALSRPETLSASQRDAQLRALAEAFLAQTGGTPVSASPGVALEVAEEAAQIQVSAGVRIFSGPPTTPLIGLGAGLQLQRVSFHLGVHGARFEESLGPLMAWHLAGGVGYRLLSHEDPTYSFALRVRGELGLGIADGDTDGLVPVGGSLGFATTELVPIAAALVDGSVLFHLGGDIDLGAVVSFGVQQGFRVFDSSNPATAGGEPVMTLHGFFGGLHLALGVGL